MQLFGWSVRCRCTTAKPKVADRHLDGQTEMDRQTDRQTDTQTDTQTHRQTESHTYKCWKCWSDQPSDVRSWYFLANQTGFGCLTRLGTFLLPVIGVIRRMGSKINPNFASVTKRQNMSSPLTSFLTGNEVELSKLTVDAIHSVQLSSWEFRIYA